MGFRGRTEIFFVPKACLANGRSATQGPTRLRNKRPTSGPQYAVHLSLHFLPFISLPINPLVCTALLPHSSDHSSAPISTVPTLRVVLLLSCWHPHNKALGNLLPTLSSSTPSHSVNTHYAFGWSPVNKLRRGSARAPTRSSMVLPKPCRRR